MNVVFALLLAATLEAADMRAVCDGLEDESAREDSHQDVDLAATPDCDERSELDWGHGDSDVERAEQKLAMRDMGRQIFERADKRAREAVAKTSLGKAAAGAHAERFYECIGVDTALLPHPFAHTESDRLQRSHGN